VATRKKVLLGKCPAAVRFWGSAFVLGVDIGGMIRNSKFNAGFSYLGVFRCHFGDFYGMKIQKGNGYVTPGPASTIQLGLQSTSKLILTSRRRGSTERNGGGWCYSDGISNFGTNSDDPLATGYCESRGFQPTGA